MFQNLHFHIENLLDIFIYEKKNSFVENSVSSHQDRNGLKWSWRLQRQRPFNKKTLTVLTVSDQISSSLESDRARTDVFCMVVSLLHRWLLGQCGHKEKRWKNRYGQGLQYVENLKVKWIVVPVQTNKISNSWCGHYVSSFFFWEGDENVNTIMFVHRIWIQPVLAA